MEVISTCSVMSKPSVGIGSNRGVLGPGTKSHCGWCVPITGFCRVAWCLVTSFNKFKAEYWLQDLPLWPTHQCHQFFMQRPLQSLITVTSSTVRGAHRSDICPSYVIVICNFGRKDIPSFCQLVTLRNNLQATQAQRQVSLLLFNPAQ